MAVKILLGTTNKEKIEEYKYLFEQHELGKYGYELEIVSNLIDVEETGETCAENARQKAMAYAKEGNCIVLADDTGIFINVLNGAPGIHSKRYGGAMDVDSSIRNVIYDVINSKCAKSDIGDLYNAYYRTSICLTIPSQFGFVNVEYTKDLTGKFTLVSSGEYSRIIYDKHFKPNYSEKTLAEHEDYIKYTARASAFDSLARFLKGNFPQI